MADRGRDAGDGSGTGVAAISVALCRSWPQLQCVGLDIAEHPLALARREVAAAELEDRIELRLLDIMSLTERNAFDVAWLPLPLLSSEIAEAALHTVVKAMRLDGWVLLAANARPSDEMAASMMAFRAAAVGGSPAYQDDVRRWLADAGRTEIVEVALPFGGAPLLAARRI